MCQVQRERFPTSGLTAYTNCMRHRYPPKETFFSILSNKSITGETYKSCLDVCNIMPTTRSGVKPYAIIRDITTIAMF